MVGGMVWGKGAAEARALGVACPQREKEEVPGFIGFASCLRLEFLSKD